MNDDFGCVEDFLLGDDPMKKMNAERAASLLPDLTEHHLDTVFKDDPDFVPYINESVGRFFLVGDVLTERARRRGDQSVPVFRCKAGTMSSEQAESVLNKRIFRNGEKHPDWFNANLYVSSKKLRPAGEARLTDVSKSIANSRIEIAGGGGSRRTHICKFSSFDDYLANAFPDDIWVFAMPIDGGRPFDFADSLHNGDERSRWVVLTYREYLVKMIEGARRDEEIAFASKESEQIGTDTRQP